MRQVINTVSDESRRLIDEAIANGMVQTEQPFAAPGNEMSRATRDLVALRRRQYRKAQKAAKDAAK